MNELAVFARGIAFACIVLLIVRTLQYDRALLSAKLFMGLCIGLGAYTIAPLLEASVALESVAVALAISVPALFWLFCDALFNYRRHFEFKFYALRIGGATCFVGLSFSTYLLKVHFGLDHPAYSPLFYLSYALRIIFIALALSSVIFYWRNDLVESRRNFRSILVSFGGAYISMVVAVELSLRGQPAPTWLEALNACSFSALLLGLSSWYFFVNPTELFTPDGIPEKSDTASDCHLAHRDEATNSGTLNKTLSNVALTHQEQQWLTGLIEAMTTKQLFRKSTLNIAELSSKLAIPEHRLRKLINSHLKYRNFNDFINHYRLDDVAAQLDKPEHAELPILHIALEAGFNSITPFNRAFKARFQLTPSEYRRRNMSEFG